MVYMKLYTDLHANSNRRYLSMARSAKEFDDLAFCKPIHSFIRKNTDIEDPKENKETTQRWLAYFYIGGLFASIRNTTTTVPLATAMAKTRGITDLHLKRMLQLGKSDPDTFFCDFKQLLTRVQKSCYGINIQELGEFVYNIINEIEDPKDRAESARYKLAEAFYDVRTKLEFS